MDNQSPSQSPPPLRRLPLQVLLGEERLVAVVDVEVVPLAQPRRPLRSSTQRWLTTGRLELPQLIPRVLLRVPLSQLPTVMRTWMTRSWFDIPFAGQASNANRCVVNILRFMRLFIASERVGHGQAHLMRDVPLTQTKHTSPCITAFADP